MLTIGLRDVRFRAQHGVHPEEGIIGGEYIINIEAELRPRPEELDDKLSNTLDYGSLFQICQEVMSTRAFLIEELAERIAAKVWDEHGSLVAGLKLEISKLHPPLEGQVGASFVRLEERK